MSSERINNLAAGLLARYVRLVFATSKRNDDYHKLKENYEGNAPLIIGGWHGTFLLAPVLMPVPSEVSAVVARHGDAELMGQMLERFGVKLIRGAGAGGKKKDKGGMFALRASLARVKSGPLCRHDGGCAARSSAPSRTWHHYACATIRAPYIAMCRDHISFQGLE